MRGLEYIAKERQIRPEFAAAQDNLCLHCAYDTIRFSICLAPHKYNLYLLDLVGQGMYKSAVRGRINATESLPTIQEQENEIRPP